MAAPTQDCPALANPTELRKELSNTEQSNTDGINHSFYQSVPDEKAEAERMRRERASYRKLIQDNIDYPYLS